MDLEHFAAISRERIPTPQEFVAFVDSQGWRIVANPDGSAILKADKSDPLAVGLARMLGREPYRTNVLKLLMGQWQTTREPAADASPREWLWRDGHRYSGTQAKHPVGAWWWRYVGESRWRVIEEAVDVACVGSALLEGAALPQGEQLASSLPGSRGP